MNNIKWYNVADTENKHQPFNFIISGRGIGKTYSCIDYCINNYSGHFLYLRNTKEQIEESAGKAFELSFGNPFKRWSLDNNRRIYLTIEKKHAVIKEDDQLIGWGAALSTFENLRGVDLSEIDLILFDEFIENRNLMFDQFRAFMSCYETINRNRELQGRPAVKVLLLSNAQRLSNPILRGLNIIGLIESMQRSGQRSYTNYPIHIELPPSAVSDAKKDTALYTIAKDTEYFKEAIENQFANDSFTGVKKCNLIEYTPVCSIDSIYIYRHKSNGRLYACGTFNRDCKHFTTKDNYLIWMRIYGLKLRLAITSDLVDYADYTTKSDLMRILKMLY